MPVRCPSSHTGVRPYRPTGSIFTSVVSSTLKLCLFCNMPGIPPSPAHHAQGQAQRNASQPWMLSCSSLQESSKVRCSSSSKNDVGDGWLYWDICLLLL